MKIKRSFKETTTTRLTLLLPKFIVTELYSYKRKGDIDINQFVNNSLENHLKYFRFDFSDNKNDIYTGDNFPVSLNISVSEAFEVGMLSIRMNLPVDKIVSDVLAFSLSLLLEQEQALENYRLETALENGRENNYGN